MNLQEYGRLPLIPERTLRRHHAFENADNRFRSAARLRQALLREQHGWPIGEYRTAKGTRRKLGSYVNSTAAAKAVNFIRSGRRADLTLRTPMRAGVRLARLPLPSSL
jgi:hypothetical protein